MTTMPKELPDAPGLNVTNIELSDVIDAPALQELMDAYFSLNSFAFAIIDIKGKVLVAGGWQDICVKFHRAHLESCKFCLESDIYLSSGIAPGTFKTYRCKNNLWDIATPIMLGERHIGNIFMGQLFFDDEELDYELFRAQARRFGYDEAVYIAALERVPRCSREVVNRAMNFCSKLAQMISKSNYNNKILADTLTKQALVEAKLAESASLHRKMIAHIGDVIVIIDRNGINRYKSPNIEKWFGWKPEEVVGFDTWVNVHPDDLEKGQTFLSALALTPNASGTMELRYRCKDGSYKWIEITIVNLLHDNSINGFLGNYHDITERKLAKEKLRQSEECFKALAEASFSGIIIHDKGLILECNKGLSDITGFSYGEHIGMNGLELIAPESMDTVLANIQSGYDQSYEVTGVRKDGSKYPLVIRGKNVTYKGREARVIEFRDITERKRMEQEIKMSEERFRLILESVSIVPWEFNIKENSWTYVGHKVTELLGYTPEEWTTLEWWLEIIHPEDQTWVPTYCADLTSRGEEHSMIYRLRAKDGSFVWVNELITVEMLDGKPNIMRGVMIDITERKQAEEAIEAARKQLAAKNKELEQLVYVASHDLRSPLVNVDGFSRELEYSVNELSALLEGGDHAMLEKALRAEFPDMVKSIGRIRASTRQMDNLLKSLLNLAHAGRASLRIETLNMDELLSQLAQSFAFHLRETGIKMIVEQLPLCQGDAVQVTQVFSNLIDNAIKYHQKDRPGVITIRGSEEGGRVLYRVEDNGMGIAESNREKIFELFHRLNPKEAEGEGLGLTMVRQILGGMNGEITVESTQCEGSAFIVSLPGVKKNRQ